MQVVPWIPTPEEPVVLTRVRAVTQYNMVNSGVAGDGTDDGRDVVLEHDWATTPELHKSRPFTTSTGLPLTQRR